MPHRLLGSLLACSLGAACSSGETSTVAPTTTSDENACLSYGYKRGTRGLAVCAQREADDRRRGFMPAYDEILIAPDQ